MILLNRFFPGIRSAISIAAGISAFKMPKVFLLALISCSIWNFLWMLLGHFLGNNWCMVEENISRIIAQYNITIFTLFISFVLFLIIRKAYKTWSAS